MYYTNGNYSMGGNFKIKKQGPIDDRMTVAVKDDLQNVNLFDGFTYNGMIVSVVDDTINNGLYRLDDKVTRTWVNVSGSSSITISQTTGTSTTEVMSQDAVTKELENKVSKDGDKQLSQENYTTDEKEKLANMTDNFKSGFANAAARDLKLTDPQDDWYVLMYDTDTIWYFKSGVWIDTGNKSTGDMLKAIYDPTGIAKDAFLMSNMVETLDKKIFTAIEKTKLSNIEEGAQVNTITSVNGKTGEIALTKNDIGLDKVNNTADIEKVVAEANKTRGELTVVVNGTETKFNGSEDKTIQVEAGGGGGSLSFATQAEVTTGVVANKAISPATLKVNNYSKAEVNDIVDSLEFRNNGYNGFEMPWGALGEEVLTTERHHNGKPLYRKHVYAGKGGNKVAKEFSLLSLGITGYDYINRVQSYLENNGSRTPLPWISNNTSHGSDYFTPASLILATVFDLSSWDYYVVLEYTKTTDTAASPTAKAPITLEGLSEIPSPKVGVEVLTPYRCPVNGKPFYSKIIDCGFIPALANHYWEKDIGISNPETTIDFITPDYPNSFVHVPNYGAFSFGMPQTWHAVGHNISFYVDNYKIAIGTANATNNNKKLYCAIKYTKTADTALSPVALVGSTKRGLPGPAGQDGSVSFNDLTPEQVEELTRNKYVRTRTSNNFLYYNKNENTAYLDIAPSQNLRIESMKVKTEEDVEYDISATQVIDEPNDIGEYRYGNIDYKTDIFGDGSCIAYFPLRDNLREVEGKAEFLKTASTLVEPVYNNDTIAGQATKTIDAKVNKIALYCNTLNDVLPPDSSASYSFFIKNTEFENGVGVNKYFMSFGSYLLIIHNGRLLLMEQVTNNYKYTNILPVNTWLHIVIEANTVFTSTVIYINNVVTATTSANQNKAASADKTIRLFTITSEVCNITDIKMFGLRIFNRVLTTAERTALYTQVNKEALEFYHGSGEKLTEAKMVNTTINLPVPKAPNEAGAKALGLQKDDLYINSSNGLSIVTT